jgi:O-antigen ligase
VPTDAMSKENVYWLTRANGNMHNAFIQIGVNYGIVALFLMCLFLLPILIFIFRRIMSLHKKDNDCTFELMLLAVATFYLCHNLFETYLFVWGSNGFGALFWLYVGYALFFLENGRFLKAKSEESQ